MATRLMVPVNINRWTNNPSSKSYNLVKNDTTQGLKQP
jgi:hypothetical protein